MIANLTFEERQALKDIQLDAWTYVRKLLSPHELGFYAPALSFADFNPLHGTGLREIVGLLRNEPQQASKPGWTCAQRLRNRLQLEWAMTSLSLLSLRRSEQVRQSGKSNFISIHYLRDNENHRDRLKQELELVEKVAGREGGAVSQVMLIDSRPYLRRLRRPSEHIRIDLEASCARPVTLAAPSFTDLRQARAWMRSALREVQRSNQLFGVSTPYSTVLQVNLLRELQSSRLFETLSIGYAIDRVLSTESFASVTYPWENQPWERLLLAVIKRDRKQAHGICNTVVQPNQWPLFDGRLTLRDFQPDTLNFRHSFWANEFLKGNPAYDQRVHFLSSRPRYALSENAVTLNEINNFHQIYLVGCIDKETTLGMIRAISKGLRSGQITLIPHPASDRAVLRLGRRLKLRMAPLLPIDSGPGALYVCSHNTAAIERVVEENGSVCRYIPLDAIDRGFPPFVSIPEDGGSSAT